MLGIPRDLIFYMHIVTLCVAGCGVLIADKIGFSWFRGKVETLSLKTLARLHNVMGATLALMILSGLALFWPAREYLVAQPSFYIKMTFVILLILNSFAIDALMKVATHTPFKEVSSGKKRFLMISGAVSLCSWIGAGVMAFFLFP
ncbi:MAG: hypothetical protein QG621_328 [Patescibacteria group bacterium]|nr:hypothetical protein [Patescibacteria group bacterium]